VERQRSLAGVAWRIAERKKEQATERRERATIGGEHEHDGRVFSAGGRTDRRPRAASCCSADCFGDTGTEDGLAHETREDREQEGEGQPDSPESNSREQIKGGRATAGNESQDTDRTDSARHHDGQETARRKRTRRTGDRRTKADTAGPLEIRRFFTRPTTAAEAVDDARRGRRLTAHVSGHSTFRPPRAWKSDGQAKREGRNQMEKIRRLHRATCLVTDCSSPASTRPWIGGSMVRRVSGRHALTHASSLQQCPDALPGASFGLQPTRTADPWHRFRAPHTRPRPRRESGDAQDGRGARAPADSACGNPVSKYTVAPFPLSVPSS